MTTTITFATDLLDDEFEGTIEDFNIKSLDAVEHLANRIHRDHPSAYSISRPKIIYSPPSIDFEGGLSVEVVFKVSESEDNSNV